MLRLKDQLEILLRRGLPMSVLRQLSYHRLGHGHAQHLGERVLLVEHKERPLPGHIRGDRVSSRPTIRLLRQLLAYEQNKAAELGIASSHNRCIHDRRISILQGAQR